MFTSTASKPASGHARHQEDILDPTIEATETHSLSEFLERQVREQILPRKIATVFNHLTPALQKDALDRYLAGQRPLAWQIVRDLLSAAPDNRWTKARICRWAVAGAGMACLPGFLFFFFIWITTPPPASPTRNKAQVANPPTVAQAPAIAQPADPPSPRVRPTQVVPKPVDLPILTPAHLELHQLSRNESILTWKSLGVGYTYTVYSGDDPAMRNIRKESSPLIASLYTYRWKKGHPHRRWLAVTATAQGREGPLSEAIRFP